MFGIKNARRSADQDEFVVGGGVSKEIAGGTTVGLGDDNLLVGHNLFQFSRSGKRLAGATAGFEKCVHLSSRDGDVGSLGHNIALELCSALAVGVGEASGGDRDRSRFFGVAIG